MKKTIFIALLFIAAGTISAKAQGGGGGNFQPQTPEERVKRVHAKIDSAFKLDATKLAEVDALFLNAYKEQDKLRAEMSSGGGQPDFQAMREKMQPINDARDAKLKPLLGDDNYKIWKEQIEPTMRGNRGGGGRPN